MILINIWFGLAQLSLMGVGSLVVQHAAHRAARSAIVLLDDDPAHFDGAPRQQLQAEGEPRLAAIRNAAYAPLSVLAPQFDELLNNVLAAPTLKASLQSDLVTTASSLAYNPVAAAIILEHDGEPVDSFATNDNVTAHVAYLFSCRVPFARQLICKSLADLKADEETSKLLERVENPSLQKVLETPGLYFVVLQGHETLPNQGANYHKKKEAS